MVRDAELGTPCLDSLRLTRSISLEFYYFSPESLMRLLGVTLGVTANFELATSLQK
jgi:hypothetical protein